ncbi:MAG: hypothetical protein ACHQ50_07075 [Fimbriimonadales bacterium]
MRSLLVLVAVLLAAIAAAQTDRPTYYYDPFFYNFDDKDVVKDLKLTSDQVAQIKSLREAMAKAIQARGEDHEGDMDYEALGPEFVAIAKVYRQEKLRKVLDASQFDRFRQLELQIAGDASVEQPEVQKALGMTRDQIEGISEIETGMVGIYGPEEKDAAAKWAKQYKDALAKLGALLTPAQREKLTKMQGPPMKRSTDKE